MIIKTFHKQNSNTFITALLILFTGFVGGYTVSTFPKTVLDWFATPLGRFIAFLSILYIYYKDDETVTLKDLVLESLIYVVILEFIGKMLHMMFPS